MITLLVSLAWSAPDPPVCAELPVAKVGERTSVAWVARRGRRARGWLSVTPTAELRGWLAEQDPTWQGRTLQVLGMRKRNTEPRAAWQVVVMEVNRDQLCRTVWSDEPAVIEGLRTCPPSRSKPTKSQDGCGHAIDRRLDAPGLTRLGIRGRHARELGYCVLPLDRYVHGRGTR